MSVNFNVAMLRNLQQPIEDGLETCVAQLSQYVAGTLSPADFDASQHIHLAAGSLTVIGCQAASRLAVALEDAMEGLSRPERRGWDAGKAQVVAQATQSLTQGLLGHLRELLADNEDLPVRLWPDWRTLTDAMEAPQHAPEELFEPDADFEDLRFAHLADDYLKDVTTGMIQRLGDAVEHLSAASDVAQTEAALREALKVFDLAYSLRHGRGYQAYWLALRARVSIGLLDPGMLEDRAEWNVLLREALLEVHKFARNARRVHPELLMKTLRPMLARWPAHWVSSHPTLAEADRRLGFRLFWETLDEVEAAHANKQAASHMKARAEDQVALITQIKQDWSLYVVGEGADPRTAMAKGMALLSARRASLDDATLSPLLDEVAKAGFELPAPGQVPDDLAIEFAAALLLIEDASERRGRHHAVSENQAQLQQRRLAAARTGRERELQQLPPLRWDTRKAERQLRAAHAAIFVEIHKDIQSIEEALSERLRDEQAPLELPALRATASLASAVLRVLECQGASAIVDGLSDLLDQTSPEALSALTLGVAGLGAYLTARENGDGEADHLLEAAHRAVVGKPLPSGTLSEEDWRRTQKPIEERTQEELEAAVVPAPVPAAIELAPEPEPAQSAPPAVPRPPVFQPDEVMVPGGYLEERRGVEIENFFLEEMDQVLAEIQIQRAILATDPTDSEARATLRRQFHTIKGSGRLAGFHGLGELAYRIEHRLDQDIEQAPAYLPQVDTLVERVSAQFAIWFSQLQSHQPARLEGAIFQAWVDESLAAPEVEVVEEATPEITPVPEAHAPSDALPSDAQVSDWSPGQHRAPEPVEDPVFAELELDSALQVAASPWPPVAPTADEPVIELGLENDEAPAPQFDALPSLDETLPDQPVEALAASADEADEAHFAGSALDASDEDERASDDQSQPGPANIEIAGWGPLDGDSYALLVEDLDSHRPTLIAAASTALGEWTQFEPIQRAAHTAGSLGATLGMSPLADLGRALELYLDRQVQGREDTQAPWTELGQEAAEALWLLIDDLVERQQLVGIDDQLLDRLAHVEETVIEGGVVEEGSITEPPPIESSVFDELDEPAALAVEALVPSAPVVDDASSDPPPSIATDHEEAAEVETALPLTEAIPASAVVEEELEPAQEQDTVFEPFPSAAPQTEEDLSSPPAESLLEPVAESSTGDQASAIDEDQLWETLFQSLATVSAELRRIGPILSILSERRR